MCSAGVKRSQMSKRWRTRCSAEVWWKAGSGHDLTGVCHFVRASAVARAQSIGWFVRIVFALCFHTFHLPLHPFFKSGLLGPPRFTLRPAAAKGFLDEPLSRASYACMTATPVNYQMYQNAGGVNTAPVPLPANYRTEFNGLVEFH